MNSPSTKQEKIMGQAHQQPWNKDRLIGQKPPLKLKDIWTIRIHLQNANAIRDLALFNLAIDSKLRGCDLVSLRVRDIAHGNQILARRGWIQASTVHIQCEEQRPH
jgi:integrase